MTNAFYELAFQSGAFQEEVAAGDFAFQQCAFQSDAFQADVCQVEETDVFPGSGYPVTGIYWGVRKVKKGKRLDDILKKAMEQIVEGEMELEPETTAAKAVELVKPHIVKHESEARAPEVDWKSVERDLAKVRELLRLWEEQVRLQDEEDILLLSEW